MTDLDPRDMVIGKIAYVPFHYEIMNPVPVLAHYVGTVDSAIQGNNWNWYRLADEGIDAIEVTADTYDECREALLAAVAARGWRDRFRLD